MKSVLFVCMANICRSPALMATLRHLAVKRGWGEKLFVDSSGLGWVHIGERPDPRSFAAAKAKGILIDHHAQQFQDHFFEVYDFIFAVDQDVFEQLKLRAGPHQKKVFLATEFSTRFHRQEMADPYYMSADGFAQMMDMTFDACEGILHHLSSSLD